MSHDPYAALRVRNYRDYMLGSFLALFTRQGMSIAIGWQIYQWTRSATALGLMGLINVLPVLLLSLPAGVVADRYDRRKIIAYGAVGTTICSTLLALLSFERGSIPHYAALDAVNHGLRAVALLFERHGDPLTLDFTAPELPIIYALLLVQACIRIIAWPARTSIVPLLLPADQLSNGITWNSTMFEAATVLGPAVGGFIVAWLGFSAVYLLDAVAGALFILLLLRVRYFNRPQHEAIERSWRGMFSGAKFIWRKKVIFAASTLDLFAVLFGAITELLPVFASEILRVGPIGLGWLRAAPSMGAIGMAMWQTHHAPWPKPGRTLLLAMTGFGLAIVVFGLSRSYVLSFAALLLSGMFDNINVVIRQSLIQLLTPDRLRGRVTSVTQIFIGSSNEIGALRGGLMVALLGPALAVTAGGVCTVAVVGVVLWTLPALKKLGPLATLTAEE
ncbi:MAG: MFS transporter [Verrucomicrobiales bacterium]|jgi:MFS family permease|nr:MFS transporter [Verrucomicrobiales bacterium]